MDGSDGCVAQKEQKRWKDVGGVYRHGRDWTDTDLR